MIFLISWKSRLKQFTQFNIQITAFGKGLIPIPDICDPTTHSSAEISSGRAQNHDPSAGHIFTAVVSYALHDGQGVGAGTTGVALRFDLRRGVDVADDARVGVALPEAADVLRDLARRFNVVYLTARPREMAVKTRRWLAGHGFRRWVIFNTQGGNKHVVDEAALTGSVHGQLGLTCVNCHQDLVDSGFPHTSDVAAPDCSNCHSGVERTYEESVHGEALVGEGNTDVPTCIACHGETGVSAIPRLSTSFPAFQAALIHTEVRGGCLV